MGSIREELATQFRSLGIATTIAMSVVFSTFAGVITGYYLDTRLFDGRTYPWLTFLCLFFGLAGGAKNFIVLSRRFSKEAEGKERGEPQETDGKTRQDDDSNRTKR